MALMSIRATNRVSESHFKDIVALRVGNLLRILGRLQVVALRLAGGDEFDGTQLPLMRSRLFPLRICRRDLPSGGMKF
jgi:hypothetical protein